MLARAARRATGQGHLRLELWVTKQGEQLLDTHTYIDAYITLASRRETVNRGNWVEDA